MKIVHDFFNQNGGGENLVKSLNYIFKCKIHTAYSKKKNQYISQSIFNFILKKNIFFVYFYFKYFFKIKSNENILFSGNHCCFSIKRCIGKKKILYAHSLPKSLFSDLYEDHNANLFISFFKKKIIKSYYNNLIHLDLIFFNSKKTRDKFFYMFPDLKKKVNTEVLYPFSNMEFIYYKKNLIKKSKNVYFVINSRHQNSKNITHILLLMKPILENYPKIKLYITQEGKMTNYYKSLLEDSKQIIFTGYLKFDYYIKLLVNSSAVIFPSRDEDFGISALDAYNLNVPVLIQKNCGFSEVLLDNYEFFYDNNNFFSLIKKLISNRNINP